MPTLLEASGRNPKEIDTGIADSEGGAGFDGKSFLKIMKGESDKHRDYVYGIHTTRGIYSGSVCYPIRSVRNHQYKFILNLNNSADFFNMLTVRNNGIYQQWIEITRDKADIYNYVLKYLRRPKEELYDILADPYEMINLAGNPEYAQIKNKLAAELGNWMKQQGDRGIDTEMAALDRQLMFDEQSWKGQEEQQNEKILKLRK